MISKFSFILCCLTAFFFLSSCNYNFYLGQQLEKEKKFEEANIEYSRAYYNNPNNTKYKEAYLRSGRQTVKILQERYLAEINKNNFFAAHTLLTKALYLTPNNPFFNEEQKKWKRVILSGQVHLPTGQDLAELVIGEKIYPVIRFNRTTSKRLLEAIIKPSNNFVAEDLLYEPTAEKYLQYNIHSIGLKYLPFTEKRDNTTLINKNNFIYLNLIEFQKPILSELQGSFSQQKKNWSSRLQIKKNNNINEEYWYPDQNFFLRRRN